MTGEDRVIRIGDADDPRIEIYRDIRELDLIRRHGHFIAEGKTVLQVLVAQDRGVGQASPGLRQLGLEGLDSLQHAAQGSGGAPPP